MQVAYDGIAVLAIPICLYVAYYRTLLESTVMLGRCFFGLLLAMALFGPVSAIFVDFFGWPQAYANAAAFFAIWAAVMILFGPIAMHYLKEDGRKMKFLYDDLSRLLVGLVAGALVAFALSASLVMLPEVEGGYLKSDTHPVAGLDRKAALVYSIFTITPHDALAPAQMEAGGTWTKQAVERMLQAGEVFEARERVRAFEERYQRDYEPEGVRQRREQILKELRASVPAS